MEVLQGERQGGYGAGVPRRRGHHQGQLGVQQSALRHGPVPQALEQRGAVGEQGSEPCVQSGSGLSRGMEGGSL